ncbi:hypothetical protein N0V94_005703 [Neodidymelliopsis sp. IMI 364377]|nr:hypothetical protein N0V94_005703 [Neodidymelliopsis sp. IMI 364377]
MAHLTEQLACTTMSNTNMNDIVEFLSPRLGSVEMDVDEEDNLITHTLLPLPASPPPYSSPSFSPIFQVSFYYAEHLSRLTPSTVPRLNQLLCTTPGMSQYLPWLNASSWDLYDCPVPEDSQELELLSLVMAMEIKERWDDGCAFDEVERKGEWVGVLPPMSPLKHPEHPFWLPFVEEDEHEGEKMGSDACEEVDEDVHEVKFDVEDGNEENEDDEDEFEDALEGWLSGEFEDEFEDDFEDVLEEEFEDEFEDDNSDEEAYDME